MYCLRLVLLVCVSTALFASAAHAQPFRDSLVQAPTLARPEPASVAGAYARTAFGPSELGRGQYTLGAPFAVPESRGALLANVFPSYSPESGLSEWGMGWDVELAITRDRRVGTLDYASDDFRSPWGPLVEGRDGYYYARGLGAAVRLVHQGDGWTAIAPDGRRFEFRREDALVTPRGIYKWWLSAVTTVTGAWTTIEYERNASGRAFVSRVSYGQAGALPTVLLLRYEPLDVPVEDFRSGVVMLLDRRVVEVEVRVPRGGRGAYAMRHRYALEHQESALGPAFYLRSITRHFPSGASEPAHTYRYDDGHAALETPSFTDIPALATYLERFGEVALKPEHASVVDLDLDGRAELEHHYRQELVTVNGGAIEVEEPASVSGADRLCRPAANRANQPRRFARLAGPLEPPRVVHALPQTTRNTTDLRVCDREGRLLSRVSVAGLWDLGDANTRMVDLDRDGRPDLLRVFASGYQVARNVSTGAGYAFEVRPRQALGATVTPHTSWVHDFNGDGLADLVVRHGGGLAVFAGIGQLAFSSQPRSYRFMTRSGVNLSPTSHGVSFVDANRDGLSDVVLSARSTLYLFVNSGLGLEEVPVPAFSALRSTGYPAVVDVAGSGETEVLYVAERRARTLALTRPSTGLLVSADDGKGTVLSFAYDRAPAEPLIEHRPVVLAELTIDSSGYDRVTYAYDYGSARLHSETRGLIGFGTTRRTGPLLFETVRFHHDDDVINVVLDSEAHDLRSEFTRYEETAYEEREHHGVRYLRPRWKRKGFRSGDRSDEVSTLAEYLTYEREVCPTRTRTTTAHGVLTEELVLDQPAGLREALHCLATTRRLSGTHADPALDFVHEARIARNDLGQTVSVEALGPDGAQLLQRVAYDRAHRVREVQLPGEGATVLEHDDASGLLSRVVSPLGVSMSVPRYDPVSDVIEELRTQRGQASYTGFFAYDELERLSRMWDDDSSAEDPLEEHTYRYPTASKPGLVASRRRVGESGGATVHEEVAKLFAADGEELASLSRIPLGWAVGGLKRTLRNDAETQGLHHAPVAADLGALTLEALFQGRVLASEQGAGFAYPTRSRDLLQQGVERSVRTTRRLEGGALVDEAVENGRHRTRTTRDAAGVVLAYEDAAGAVTGFRYDALGRIVGVRLPDGKNHRLRYDFYGRPAELTRDGVGRIAYTYDAVSGLASSKKVWGSDGVPERRVVWQRDAHGRVVAEHHESFRTSDAVAYRFDYDGRIAGEPQLAGQLGQTTRVSGPDFERRHHYRRDGRLAETRLKLADWREVVEDTDYYDDGRAKRQTTEVRDRTGRVLTRVEEGNLYDAWGRLQAVTVNGQPLYSLRYDDEGNVARVVFASGEVIAYHYDPVTRRPSGYFQDAGDWNGGVDYQLDERGSIARETYAFDDAYVERRYEYDARGYLETAVDGEERAAYGYDVAGLPSYVEDAAGSRAIVRESRRITAGKRVYRIDALGRVVESDGLALEYGAHGEIAVARRGGGTWEYRYDEDGNRLLKLREGRVEAAYVGDAFLDDEHLIVPVKVAGRLVGILDNGRFELLATDPRGTLVAENGAPVSASPYGVRAQRPELSRALDFVEKGYDEVLGTVRFGVRDYDPYLGQFWSADPLFLEGIERCVQSPVECNLYSYAGNNPISFTDPDGTSFRSWWEGVRDRAGAIGANFAEHAGSFGLGAVRGVIIGIAGAAVFSAISALSAPLAAVIGVAALGYAAYQLATHWDQVSGAVNRLLSGEGTAEDWEALGEVVGGVIGGAIGGRAAAAARRGLAARAGAQQATCTTGTCTGGRGCFAEGTLVHAADGAQPIEALRVGDRVDELQAGACPATQVDESWQEITLELVDDRDPSHVVEVELLRPLTWLAERAAGVGDKVYLALEELGARGWAKVLDVEPARAPEPGPGCVVLATFRHRVASVLALTLATGALHGTVLATPTHPLYSRDRQDWIPVAMLRTGETLESRTGPVTVVGVAPQPGTFDVYNLEVEGQHAYEVGPEGVWAHNNGYGDAARSRSVYERYLDALRAQMERPRVRDARLSRLLDDLFRPGARIGNGSTAAAVRHEAATGGTVGGRTHSQKAADYIRALTRWLDETPGASESDRRAAQHVLRDLQNALEGR